MRAGARLARAVARAIAPSRSAALAALLACIPVRAFAQSAPPVPATGTPAPFPAASAVPSPYPSPAASPPAPSPSPPAIPAGVVPPAVTVELAGTVSAAFVSSRVQAAIAQAAQLRPGATLTVTGVTVQPLAPGATLDAQAFVQLAGHGAYSDVAGTTAVSVRVDALAPLDPSVLFYSDDPEEVGAGIEGVLFSGTLDVAHPVRTYVYHVSQAPQRRIFLALATQGTARVQVLGAQAGPSNAFPFVGHMATVRYLEEHRPQESFVAALAAGAPLLVPLDPPMNPGDLVAAIYDVRLLQGDPVQAAIVTVLGATDPAALIGQPELAGDGHGRRGAYSLAAVAPFALAFAVGGPEPEPFEAGLPRTPDGAVPFPNLRPGGRALAGDYGVLRTVALSLSNPSAAPQTVYLYETPEGGGATTTIWFDPDAAPTQVPCVSDSTQRYEVASWTLAPGESRTVDGTYMTDGTSSFPLVFGLTAVAPVPVTASLCNGRPAERPAPSASPLPAISPTPEAGIPPMTAAGPRPPRRQAYGNG